MIKRDTKRETERLKTKEKEGKCSRDFHGKRIPFIDSEPVACLTRFLSLA